MKRKTFLSSVFISLAATRSLAMQVSETKQIVSGSNLLPPYLKKGDTVGITSPAGYITLPEIQSAVSKLKEWDYQVKIGDTIGKRAFTFGGTDEERKNDLQQMLDDPNVKAILCARGGYGLVRIVDQLNFYFIGRCLHRQKSYIHVSVGEIATDKTFI